MSHTFTPIGRCVVFYSSEWEVGGWMSAVPRELEVKEGFGDRIHPCARFVIFPEVPVGA